MEGVKVKNYNLYTDSGAWLGQVVLTSDGMFASVTDWGNLSFAWRRTGDDDFRCFMAGLDVEYFGNKLYQGNTYILSTKTCRAACMRFSEKILPVLQSVLKKELEDKVSW